MAQYKGFTFDGINSADYGVVITGASTYSAPERAVEMYEIPGRNGALAIDQGRFANIEITYHCAMADRNQTDFAQRLSALRNQLCSRYSYVRLTDDYNADEYRLALYKSGLDTDLVIDRGGEFDVVFDCKPQRFLTSGESTYQIGEWGETISETGDIVTYQGDDLTAVKSLTTDMEPIQDLHGYDNPWPGGGGKNKLPKPIAGTYTANGITLTVNDMGVITVSGTATAGGSVYVPLEGSYVIPTAVNNGGNGTMFINNSFAAPNGNGFILYNTAGSAQVDAWSMWSTNRISYNYSGMAGKTVDTIGLQFVSGQSFSGTIKPMFTEDGTTTLIDYVPYSNICPISGRTGANVYVSPTTSAQDATTYPITWQTEAGTVYGGEVDVVSGVLTVDRAMVTFNGDENWNLYDPDNADDSYWIQISDKVKQIRTSISNAYENIAGVWGSVGIGKYGVFSDHATLPRLYFRPPNSSITSLDEWKTWLASNPLQVVYKLAAPITYPLTPQQVETLIGTNNIWSDAGEVTVEYGTDPYTMVNNTLFDANPLIKVTGYGQVGFGDVTITITGTAGVVTYIDCDLMECYRMSGGAIVPANQYVTFTGTDFPTIPTGKTRVTSASTISKVEVVPRWWIL